MILILDNYDSFTYNLYQVFLKLNYEIKVFRSDKITIKDIEKLDPDYIVLSPGPGTPDDSGICVDVVKELKGKYPILGVCLGHQAILAAFDVPIVKAARIVHGKVEKISHSEKGIFRNIPQSTLVTRYHSLAGKEKDIPDCFEISAKSEDDEIMAVEHKEYCLVGLQFHPESIGTKDGEKIIKNFLHYKRDNLPIKDYLKILLSQNNITENDAYEIMDELTEGNLAESQIASMLTSMQIKDVTAEELAGFARVLKTKAAHFPLPKADEKRLDTCGTGGSRDAKTFNVSTIVSLLLAAGGANVVKHGNKAVTSKVGSADLLEHFGLNIEMDIKKSYEIYDKLGFTFLYARKFHLAMRFAAPTRAALGFRTLFNIIGPLSNPAHATHQIIGVFDEKYTEILCKALKYLGIERAMVVHGSNGLDEITLTGATKISELKNGWIKTYTFDPQSIGLKLRNHKSLVGGDIYVNTEICRDILEGKQSAKADLVYLNAGAAFYIYGLAKNIKEGYSLAKSTAKTQKGLEILERAAQISNEK